MKPTKRRRKAKALYTVSMLLNYIHKNFKSLKIVGNIVKEEIDHGDEWNSETGYQYIIKARGLTIGVGEVTVVEDRENYAQADSWQQLHCTNLTKGTEIHPSIVHKLIKLK